MKQEPRARQSAYPWYFGLVAVLLLTFKLAVVDRMETPFRHSKLEANGILPGVERPLNQPYADGLVLIGFDQSPAQASADGMLHVDLHWTVRRQPLGRYQTVIHLVGADGLRWSPSDTYRPTDYEDAPPTSTWMPGTHALDSHEIEPLPGTPPGTYAIVLTVFDRETLRPLSVLNEQLQPTAPDLTLGQVEIVAPHSAPQPEGLGIRERLDISFGPLTLLGVSFDRERASPGDPVFVTTFWRVDGPPPEESVVRLELLAPDGSMVRAYDFPLTASWHPPSAWEPGGVWRGQQLIHLPADLNTAEYTWALSISTSKRPPSSFGSLSVQAPARVFASPPTDLSLNARLGDVATLVGASLAPPASSIAPGSPLTVTLVWRAEVETTTSYSVFVHLLDPDGKLIAQSDGIPDTWSRPTTGWVSGEYITDEHLLVLPPDAAPGTYELTTGMYVSSGVERLTTPDGRDTIAVTALTVEAK